MPARVIAHAAWSRASATAAQRAVRSRSALAPVRPLWVTTPSIMSATTAGQGRPRNTTATVAPPSRRRWIVRVNPTRRGGLRNVGGRTPWRRAASVSDRAIRAKRSDVGSTRPSCSRHMTNKRVAWDPYAAEPDALVVEAQGPHNPGPPQARGRDLRRASGQGRRERAPGRRAGGPAPERRRWRFGGRRPRNRQG